MNTSSTTSEAQLSARIRSTFSSRIAVQCVYGARETVTIEILEWGSPQESLEILMYRRKNRPAREMVARLLVQNAT